MQEVCLTSASAQIETLKEFFCHTNPLHQHLCWYPDAQNGDVRRVNGVPVWQQHCRAVQQSLPVTLLPLSSFQQQQQSLQQLQQLRLMTSLLL
jgi:hypothetical protein